MSELELRAVLKGLAAKCEDCGGKGQIEYYESGDKYADLVAEPCDNELHIAINTELAKLEKPVQQAVIGKDPSAVIKNELGSLVMIYPNDTRLVMDGDPDIIEQVAEALDGLVINFRQN